MGMVDIGDKKEVERIAIAEGKIKLQEKTIKAIRENKIKKGDVFSIATAAGMLAAKKTFLAVPHCHPIPIEAIDFEFDIKGNDVIVRCTVKAKYKTGVEMEALNGVSMALLTIWDMVKYLEKDENGQYPSTKIYDIKVLKKVKNG